MQQLKSWPIDNDQYPCIFSEKLIFEMADRMAEDGFKEAGYEYVSIDVSVFCPLCKFLLLFGLQT